MERASYLVRVGLTTEHGGEVAFTLLKPWRWCTQYINGTEDNANEAYKKAVATKKMRCGRSEEA